MRINILLFRFMLLVFLIGCSKNDSPPADPCDGVVITVTATKTDATSGNNGSITASANGGSGISFSLNGGAAQSSGSFTNLAPGTYTITARSSAGCTGTTALTINNADACAGKTITVSAAQTSSDACTPTGSITVTASGSTSFTYRLGASGTAQASNSFSNLAAGSYTVFAKDAAGCENSASIVVGTLPNGPLFTAVKSLISSQCGSCHISTTNGGANFGTDCSIVTLSARIKVRAVDIGDMPQGAPLTAAQKKIITDWINAGARASL